MKACGGSSFLFVSYKFTDHICFSLHILAEIYLDAEAYGFRPLNSLKMSRCLSLLFSKTKQIVKVVFSNIIVLCLVLLQTFTFFLLSFSTVICYFRFFVIILNSCKLLEVCYGVERKIKIQSRNKSRVGKQMAEEWPVLLAHGRHCFSYTYTLSSTLPFVSFQNVAWVLRFANFL